MNILMLVCFVIWIYLLTVLKRAKLGFFFFLCGCVGMFFFMLFWLQPLLTLPMTKLVAAVAGFFGELTGVADSYFDNAMLFIQNKENSIVLYIDYECSGIIEIMVFTSLLWFFPVYNIAEKVIVNILGIIWVFVSNIIRILSICTLVYLFGNDAYFFAHTILGRVIFYALSILLYFFVFTRSQIVRQKVGSFKYERND